MMALGLLVAALATKLVVCILASTARLSREHDSLSLGELAVP